MNLLEHEIFSSLPFPGVVKLGFHFPEKDALELFRYFNAVCTLVDNEYESAIFPVDKIIERFIAESGMSIANNALKLKNINKTDSFKYKLLSNVDYDIYASPYLNGLYEYLVEREAFQGVPCEVLEFFARISRAHALIANYLDPFIKTLEGKVKCITSLKIWRHLPKEENTHFLPIHCDRTLFTIVICTESSGEECLRLYAPTSEVDLEKVPFYRPKKDDFPLLFCGKYAKDYFGMEPTPHGVVRNPCARERHSLVLFIARQEGW